MDQSAMEPRLCLVIDDDHDTADTLAMVLEQQGFRAVVAYGGAQGFETAEKVHPDIVLLDLAMPDGNGLDLCRRIRSQPWGEKVRLIVISGMTQAAEKNSAELAGCDFYLVKPSHLSDLLMALKA